MTNTAKKYGKLYSFQILSYLWQFKMFFVAFPYKLFNVAGVILMRSVEKTVSTVLAWAACGASGMLTNIVVHIKLSASVIFAEFFLFCCVFGDNSRSIFLKEISHFICKVVSSAESESHSYPDS